MCHKIIQTDVYVELDSKNINTNLNKCEIIFLLLLQKFQSIKNKTINYVIKIDNVFIRNLFVYFIELS